MPDRTEPAPAARPEPVETEPVEAQPTFSFAPKPRFAPEPEFAPEPVAEAAPEPVASWSSPPSEPAPVSSWSSGFGSGDSDNGGNA